MALGDVIARLAVSLTMETAAFEKGSTIAEKRLAQTQKKFEKLGDQIGGIGQKMTIGLTAPLTAFGVSAFNAASDAAELQSAFNQTFGDLAGAMNEWAEATGNAMGRSTQELQRAANTFGIFFNQAAPTREEAAKMSQTFTVLAQDLASFYNVSESDALQKLRSGLSGESEPLRDFGVFLSEAAVKAQGLEMGLGGLSGELSEQEKIMARYALILESTSNAQGDVARTSDGTANKMREAKAAFEELQVVVGTKLLPAITPLIDKLGSLIEWFTQLPAPVQEGTLVVAGIAAALGPLLMVVGQLTTALPLLMKAMTFLFAHPVILGAAVLIGGIYLAWKNWDKITAIVQNVYQGVKTWMLDKLGAIFDSVKRKIQMVEGAFRWLWDKVVGNSWVPDMVDGVQQHFGRLDGVMVKPAMDAVGKVNTAFAGLAGAGGPFAGMPGGQGVPGALAAISEAANDNADGVEAANVRIVKSLKEMADETLSKLSGLANAIKSGGFLGILEAVIGLGLQLGSIGAFGSKIASRINAPKVPGYANGTNFHPGGLAVVGERGPELVSMPRGSRVTPNGEWGGGGKLQVEVVANNNGFGAIVRNHAGQVVAEAAPSLMAGGAAVAGAQMARSKKWSLA